MSLEGRRIFLLIPRKSRIILLVMWICNGCTLVDDQLEAILRNIHALGMCA